MGYNNVLIRNKSIWRSDASLYRFLILPMPQDHPDNHTQIADHIHPFLYTFKS